MFNNIRDIIVLGGFMDNNDAKYDNLAEKLINLARSERSLASVNGEIANVLDKRDELISITEYLYEKISSFSQNIGIDAAMEVVSSKGAELEIGDAQGKELVKRKIK